MQHTTLLRPFAYFQLSEKIPTKKEAARSIALSECKNTITGRVIDLKYSSGHPDLKLAFYSRGFFGGVVSMGTARTDSIGKFTFNCNLRSHFFSKTTELVIKIINEVEVFPGLNCPGITCDIPVDEVTVKVVASERLIDLGDFETKVNVAPTDLADVPAPLPSQLPSISYFLQFVRAAGMELPKRLLVTACIRWLTASQVQKIYDFTLFGLLGRTYPKVVLTEELLLEELQNRICHTDYRIEGSKLIFSTHWDETAFIRKDSLAHMQVVYNILKDGLKLDYISRRYPDETEATISRSDDHLFPKALKDAFNNFAYDGEGRYHLGCGHILPVIPALTKDAHLSKSNPIATVLSPHLKGTVFIGNLGKQGIVFGQGGVLNRSAYSVDGVNKFILSAAVSKANWQDYMPPTPASISDKRSRAERICFEVLLKFFTQFIDQHREEIGKYWLEIYHWSEHMSSLITTLPRITSLKENPTAEDFVNLVKFCAWLVNITTFIHWSAHSRQQLLTDITQVSLGVRNKGYQANGETDPFNGTTAEDTDSQLFTSRVLLAFEDGGLFKNRRGVDPRLISCYQERFSELETLYPDFKDMFASVDI